MQVFLAWGGGKRQIERADVPEGCGPAHDVPMFGAAFVIAERFAIGSVTHSPAGGAPVMERAVMVPPRWEPFASWHHAE